MNTRNTITAAAIITATLSGCASTAPPANRP